MKSFWTGTPEEHERVSTLLPEQQQLFQQLQQAGMRPGAGGAFGTAADYYRNLLSNNPEDMAAFAAPEQRNFRENIIPGLSEQFAGMGAGGLSSSGFRNATVGAGTDLAERLGAIRAQLRQQGAAGLFGIGQTGLGNFSQDVMTQPGTQGLLAPALGALGSATLGPAAGAIGSQFGNYLSNSFNQPKVGRNTSPYGQQTGMGTPPNVSNFQMPNFNMSR